MNDYISRLTLRLPKILHRQLIDLAQEEAISLNQYIINALTRQVSSTYRVETISKEDVAKQEENFDNLSGQLRRVDTTKIEKVLSHRQLVQPEPELTPDVINQLQTKIKNQK